MSLSGRIRPGVEAAPWVAEEVTKLEQQLAAAQARIQELREALAYHQEQTRPIHTSLLALAKPDDLSALEEAERKTRREALLEAAQTLKLVEVHHDSYAYKMLLRMAASEKEKENQSRST